MAWWLESLLWPPGGEDECGHLLRLPRCRVLSTAHDRGFILALPEGASPKDRKENYTQPHLAYK